MISWVFAMLDGLWLHYAQGDSNIGPAESVTLGKTGH
jgi:hypothetical protein